MFHLFILLFIQPLTLSFHSLILMLTEWFVDWLWCFSLFAAAALQSSSSSSSSSSSLVYGCEMSRLMSQTALNIVSQSSLSQWIHIINKKSTELQCPADLPIKLVSASYYHCCLVVVLLICLRSEPSMKQN